MAVEVSAQATFELLPGTARALKVSADGTLVSGSANGGGFTWTSGGGVTLIGGSNDSVGSSDDGTVLGGTMPSGGFSGPGRWTSGSGWVDFPTLGVTGCPDFGSAYDISADGSTVVGLGWNGCSALAFKWDTVGGIVALPQTGSSARANGISGDGQVIGGWQQFANRSPCIWLANGNEILLNTSASGEIHGLNSDGSLAVGEMNGQSIFWSAANGVTNLGNLPGFFGNSGAYAVSEGGLVAGGGAGFASPFDPTTASATIWAPDTGVLRGLREVLEEQGAFVPAEFTLQFLMGISADGSVIAGQAAGPGFANFVGFVATLDPELIGPWTDLGQALAGATGDPKLTGKGLVNAGNEISINLFNALGSSTAWLAVGFSQANAPFKGGTMVPSLAAPGFVISLPTSAGGEVALNTAWPNGVPSGFELFLQYWIQDGAGPVGFSASNGLKATVP
jgi:uncharacterized membrane protein